MNIYSKDPISETSKQEIQTLIQSQREFFTQGYTKKISYRIKQLKKLREVIFDKQDHIIDALKRDFFKPPFETVASEIELVNEEINFAIKHISYWARPLKVKSSLLNYPSEDYIYRDPYGTALILAPWNYPFQLVISPLIASISGGNTSIIKPSELAPNTAFIIEEIVKEAFDFSYVAVVQGGAETATNLLENKLDKIFFTGSTRIGKIVMEAAAQYLTPITLELGGKSPCIVDKSAIINIAARRIVWGKFFNGGQTCIAPDYVLVHESRQNVLVKRMTEIITEFYGDNPEESEDFARMINHTHFDRLNSLLQQTITEGAHIVSGGQTDRASKYIAPTIIQNVHFESPIMKEEIFGPLLPIIPFSNIQQAIQQVNALPKPLSLYLFSEKSNIHNLILGETSSGGVCINDTLAHYANPNLPFGGVGQSGMGNYHGKAGFIAFTHAKSVLKRSTWLDIPLRYPPYKGKLIWLKRALKWI